MRNEDAQCVILNPVSYVRFSIEQGGYFEKWMNIIYGL
jgi:hypothetical protein